jgi:hypothetical protein
MAICILTQNTLAEFVNEVNDEEDVILCEASCQKWFPWICTGMIRTAYGLLTAEASTGF